MTIPTDIKTHAMLNKPELDPLAVAKSPDWKGFTIDRLRYQRAYVSARLDIEKDILTKEFTGVKSRYVAKTNFASRMLNIVDIAGYVVMAFKIFKGARGLFKR